MKSYKQNYKISTTKQNGWNEAIGEGEAPDVIKPDNANFTFNSKGFVKTNKNRLIRANTNKNEI